MHVKDMPEALKMCQLEYLLTRDPSTGSEVAEHGAADWQAVGDATGDPPSERAVPGPKRHYLHVCVHHTNYL